ncbi:obscurin-like [Pagrus major]|uniref:obscurin-like n=1 Tax=Pagrus major TaxID=143350 RepID=UPI003CC86C51
MTATFYKDGSVIENDTTYQSSAVGEMKIRVSESDEGWYKCTFDDGTESAERDLRVKVSKGATLTLQPNWPQIFSGETITLRCEIKYGGDTEWTYEWYKDNLKTTTTSNEYRIISATEAHSGEHRCKGRRDSYFSTRWSDVIKLTVSFHNKAVVTLQPNWSEIYRGETITLRCEIKDGGDTEWEYEWKTTSSEKPSNQNEHRIWFATESHSGDYWCKGRKKSEKSSTDWSDPIKLTVSDKPRPVLTVSPSWLSAGASVTLNCSVKDPSAGWRFYWYKTVPDPSNYFYSYELLPGNSSGTEQDSYIVHGQTHTAGYRCIAGRGDPVSYTDYSKPKFVWSADFHSSASLTVSPDRAQHFTSDSVSLSCEGNSAEWRVKWLSTEDRYLSDCSTWRTMTGSTCNIDTYWRSDAVYWCESGSGEFSNAVNITIQANRPKAELRADDRDIPVGGSVTLTCSVNPSSSGWKYFWYRGEKTSEPLTTQLSAGRIRVSEEGVYWCRGGRGEPVYYTEYSDPITINKNVPNRATLILQPNQPQVFIGERITLRCEIQGGGDTEWTYEWSKNNFETPTRYNESRIISATEAYSGEHRCKGRNDTYSSTEWSDAITLTVLSNRPKAELRAYNKDIPVGGSVTLTCSVNPSSSGWKYFWYRGEKPSEHLTTQLLAGRIRVSEEGVYWCRGGRGEPVYYTEYSDSITISKNVHNKAVVTLQPNWSEIYRGETITLRCEIKDGGDTEWEYEWKTTSKKTPSNQIEHRIRFASASHSGDYRCKGRKKSEKSSTDWSYPIKLTVSDKLEPYLTVSPSWLSAGALVTLNCSVEDPSAGWRFYWYKAVPDQSDDSYSIELLPGSSGGTEQDSYIVHGQTHTAGYRCRAGRGDPVSYTYYSEPEFVWSADFHSSASLTVSPDRAHHFTSDSVSLSCEGNSTKWRVKRLSAEDSFSTDCSSWRTMTGSTCKLSTYGRIDAVFWCESGSGEFSNAVNITIQDKNIILLSPARPVTERDSVSLSCKLRKQTFGSTVFFYHNEKLIQSDTRWELNISAVSKSDEGFYKCQHSGRESAQSWMSANRPKAELRADNRDIPVGGSVTLTCSVNPSSSGWKYFWYRGEKTSEHLTTQLSAGQIRVSEEGVYWCRGGRGEPVYYTEYSDPITINKKVANKAVVTLQPNWSEIYFGEMITLRCEIKDGGDTEWEYEWKTTSSEKPSNQNEHRIRFAAASHNGDYRCKGRKKSEKSSTDWSDPFKLTVSDKPRPVLTVSPSWLSAGASVTLNCSVEDQSAGWRFYWYKALPDSSDDSYSSEMLPGSSSGTKQDSYIVHGQTHTAGYICKAGRGDPVSYTDYSEPKFVWSGDFHSSVSLTASPDRAQHFISDSVSLNCEGNSGEWRVKRLATDSRLSDCSSFGTMIRSTCSLHTVRQSDAVYWCESESREFSNAVNITIQDTNMILLSPARPVTVGDYVSLSCYLRRQTFGSIVFFYHNEKLIQNDTRWELKMSSVSKSDEGFYKCQHTRKDSARSWMSVQGPERFPVLLIVGLVCGIVLVMPLLVLFCYKACNGETFFFYY